MENHIAKPEDFRQAAEVRKSDDAQLERVVLPKSQYAVMLRRPTPMWFLLHGHLPLSLAARNQGTGDREQATVIETPEDFVQFSRWMVDLLTEVFVGPKLSLHPGPNEISPEWLDEDDVNFIIRWAVGEVAAARSASNGASTGSEASRSHDLAPFRGQSRPAAAGAGGGNVSHAAKPAAAGNDDGTAD